jgi:thymidine kinase
MPLPNGKITMIVGPMGSSKTTTLISYAKRFQVAKKNVIIIKYAKDNRYENSINLITHDKNTYEPTFQTNTLFSLETENLETLMNSNNILIDEAQFFPDLVSFCDKYADLGKTIVVAGLDSDYERKPFQVICNLVAIADDVIKLKAVCTLCGFDDAIFTKRLVANTEKELIGGMDSYTPNCRSCHAKQIP